MTTKRKIIGRFVPIDQLHRLKAETPVEALRLSEDILSIKVAIDLVTSVDPANIMDSSTQGERDTAWELRQNLIRSLVHWRRYAENKLRKEHLAT
jgi:hypothetical protein